MGHKSSGTVLGKSSSASACHGYHPVWAGAGLLPCAYLRDFVVKSQFLPFHTFIESEDKADVVSISLPNEKRREGRWCQKTVAPPQLPQLPQLPLPSQYQK